MQIDQFLRRALWRLRRRVQPGADNEPLVSVEPQRPPPSNPPMSPKPPLRRRDRWVRTAVAFITTFALLAAGYAVLVAANSRVPLDAGFIAPPDPGGDRATSAATALLALDSGDALAGADDLLVIPNGRRLRAERIKAGAASVVAAYVDLLAAAQTPLDPALADALEAVRADDPAATRDALMRFNNRIARGRATSGAGPARVADIAAAAAAACERESAMLNEIAEREQGWMASPMAQAQASHARGVAFGWLLLLRGALADAPDVASATVIEASAPLDALAAAAETQPLFLFNGGPQTPWSPPHVRRKAGQFARAAVGAQALASAALRASPSDP